MNVADYKIVIFSELKNLLIRLASAAHVIQEHLGVKDKVTLRWIKSLFEKYRDDCPKEVLENLQKLIDIPDEQFELLKNFHKAEKNMGLNLKTHSLSLTESLLQQLSIFDSKFQRRILEILSQIKMLNEEIESATYYHRLTFDSSAMKENSDIIQTNLSEHYSNITEKCKFIAKKIEAVL